MLKVMRFVMRYWGVILVAIEFVETVTDDQTSGETKKMMVLEAVLETLKNVGIAPTRFAITLISSAIDMMVSVLNAVSWGEKLEPEANLEADLKARIKSETKRVTAE